MATVSLSLTAFVLLRVKVHTVELCIQSSSVNFHLLRLVVQLVLFSEVVARRSALEAHHCP
jgi:hypothetical protein